MFLLFVESQIVIVEETSVLSRWIVGSLVGTDYQEYPEDVTSSKTKVKRKTPEFVGGDATWREYLTLPNLLKEFNPRVTGYSMGKAEFLTPSTALNVAFPVSADQDALSQAKSLVFKMKQSPAIDFENDWKV